MSVTHPGAGVVQFLGATETVTGSRFLVEGPRSRLLVDCGLYQGPKPLRERNWQPFPIDPASLDAVVLTHAHVDHSGYLPALARDGFRGPVYCTRRTAELCHIVLPDAGHLQEEEAAYANRKGYSKHEPALPLFTAEDAEAMLDQLHPVGFDAPREVAPGVLTVFRRAGHILGSAHVTLQVEGAPGGIGFSGDLGRPSHPLLRPPEPPQSCDAALVIESTYGDRSHDDARLEADLADAIRRTAERGGVIVIPAFAVDRTEVVLYRLKQLMDRGLVPQLPVYADSPMALDALEVYRSAVADGDEELRPGLAGEGDPFDPGNLIEARDVSDSKAIHEVSGPAIIVSASGMATGGRVLHHLARRLSDPANAVFLVGFQPAHTRGRELLDGRRLLKMLGRYVPVRAEIVDVTGLSVHADRGELLGWLRSAKTEPQIVYVVHGEPGPSHALRDAIERELGWNAVVPKYRERVLINGRG